MFEIGQLVFVESRTGPYENKEGGVATILEVSQDQTKFTVRYVLQGKKEIGLDVAYLKPYEFSDHKSRRKPRNSAPATMNVQQINVATTKKKSKSLSSKSIKHINTSTTIQPDQEQSLSLNECKQEDVHEFELISNENQFLRDIEPEENLKSNFESTPNNLCENTENSVVIDSQVLQSFTKELSQRFKDDRLPLSTALSLLPDENTSLAYLKELQQNNRIFIEFEKGCVWRI